MGLYDDPEEPEINDNSNDGLSTNDESTDNNEEILIEDDCS